MKKWNVHYMGYYGYDVVVEAENEEEAKRKAEPIFGNTSADKYTFIPDGVDVWEE